MAVFLNVKPNFMSSALRILGLLCLSSLMSSWLQGQVINFDNTWEEFLNDPKSSSISKLPEPQKENFIDYAKYCLMYANSHFCADEINEAQKFMSEIKQLGKDKYGGINRFEARYLDLQSKIEVYFKMSAVWKDFQSNNGSLKAFNQDVELAKSVCEKGTLAKYHYLASREAYCKGDLKTARELFEKRVLPLERAGLDMKRVPGLEKEVQESKKLYATLDKLAPAWKKFVDTDQSDGFADDIPYIACYPIPTVQIYLLRAKVNPCKFGPELLRKIEEIQAQYKQSMGQDVEAKIQWLKSEVGAGQEEIQKINQIWTSFLPKEELKQPLKDLSFDYPCDRGAQIKAYTMIGLTERCVQGKTMLDNIDKTLKEHKPQLDAATEGKVKKLRDLVKKDEEELANLNKAWKEFLPQDTLTSGIKFAYEYCDKLAQVRAHLMTGIIEYCTKGEEMLAGAEKTRQTFKVELDGETQQRLDKLKNLVDKNRKDLADLNALWKDFVAQKDTLDRQFTVQDFYCDKIAQVKSWAMKGHVKACDEGQQYLDNINNLQKKHSLKFDKELECSVNRLRQKVWDCRYWELVRQAQRETHAERESFGPKSAKVMELDLNTQKMPCPTTVLYEPLGYIGVKYTITTFLCSNIDLAKMGDPEYYKKIAKWVDTEVLSKYCLANMRCKEEFFIYIEGHSDGNPFPGANYKESFEIPQGTPFMHYTEKDTVERKTDRAITTRLNNNMELGLARAWTIKQQLDFMKVPIKVGAYEHPAKNKGGEFRRMETELNITNLLLDFYEKRLADLLKASGIGERPKDCR